MSEASRTIYFKSFAVLRTSSYIFFIYKGFQDENDLSVAGPLFDSVSVVQFTFDILIAH